jgi:hypothetical protein
MSAAAVAGTRNASSRLQLHPHQPHPAERDDQCDGTADHAWTGVRERRRDETEDDGHDEQ